MKIVPKRKLELLIEYWSSGRKVSAVATSAGISKEIIRRWDMLVSGSSELIFKDDVKNNAQRKLEAVTAYYESGRRVRMIAERFEISPETIRTWVGQLNDAADHIFGNRGSVGEILRLRRALAASRARVLELEEQLEKYQIIHGQTEQDDSPGEDED